MAAATQAIERTVMIALHKLQRADLRFGLAAQAAVAFALVLKSVAVAVAFRLWGLWPYNSCLSDSTEFFAVTCCAAFVVVDSNPHLHSW